MDYQKLLNQGEDLIFSKNTTINKKLIVKKDNTKIVIKEGVEVKFNNSKTNECAFLILANNVEINGGCIAMNREGSDNRHAIVFRGAKNFIVRNTYIKEPGGDGIFVGANKKTKESSEGKIINCRVDKPKRLGISIMSCIGLNVIGCTFSGAEGDRPMSGVDIEPNPNEPWQKVLKVLFKDCIFKDNKRNGIQLGLGHYVGKETEPLDITFIDCESYNNGEFDLKVNMSASKHSNVARGNIVLDNITFEKGSIKCDVDPKEDSAFLELKNSEFKSLSLFKPKSSKRFQNVHVTNYKGKVSLSRQVQKTKPINTVY